MSGQDVTDRRASIRAKPDGWDDLFCTEFDVGSGHILAPLRKDKRGLVFPYTPDIIFNPMANWSSQNFSHSNYAFNSWENSDVGDITINADFTANTNEEARYMAAVIHFLKGSMKGGFGREDDQRGVPPGVYNFNYLGDYQFRNVPVVIQSVSFNYAKDIDYVPVNVSLSGADIFAAGKSTAQTWVPIHMQMMVILKPQYNIKTLRDNFSLKEFRKGSFLTGHKGGFL